jgi:hypothetical protein
MGKPQFLAAVILSSRSPARLARFYRDLLGVPLERRGPRDFSAMLGQTHFAIHAAAKGQEPTQRAELGLHFADLTGLVKELTARRVALDQPIRDYPWARSAQVSDPDGNVVYLMELPQAALDQVLGRRRSKPEGRRKRGR